MESDREKNDSSSYILVTSSNMLGLCFIVITSLKALDLSHKTLIDELSGVAMLLFLTSCVLSFLSMRGKVSKSYRYEIIADYIFLSGVIVLFITATLLVLLVIE